MYISLFGLSSVASFLSFFFLLVCYCFDVFYRHISYLKKKFRSITAIKKKKEKEKKGEINEIKR